jgi:hypothetical protein
MADFRGFREVLGIEAESLLLICLDKTTPKTKRLIEKQKTITPKVEPNAESGLRPITWATAKPIIGSQVNNSLVALGVDDRFSSSAKNLRRCSIETCIICKASDTGDPTFIANSHNSQNSFLSWAGNCSIEPRSISSD